MFSPDAKPLEVAFPQQFVPSVAQGMICGLDPRLLLGHHPEEKNIRFTESLCRAPSRASGRMELAGVETETQQQGEHDLSYPALPPKESCYGTIARCGEGQQSST